MDRNALALRGAQPGGFGRIELAWRVDARGAIELERVEGAQDPTEAPLWRGALRAGGATWPVWVRLEATTASRVRGDQPAFSWDCETAAYQALEQDPSAPPPVVPRVRWPECEVFGDVLLPPSVLRD